MNSQPNPNPSPLEALTEPQRDQLFAWLETHKVSHVLQLVARPEPDGFGIATHDNTLRRWHRREKLARRPSELEFAQQVIAASKDDPLLDQATATLLRQAAFDLSSAPKTSARDFKALARWVLKLRQQQHEAELLALKRERLARQLELEKQRLALETKKFEFNAARQAICHLPELMEIVKDPKKDDEDKIRAAREKLFGSAP